MINGVRAFLAPMTRPLESQVASTLTRMAGQASDYYTVRSMQKDAMDVMGGREPDKAMKSIGLNLLTGGAAALAGRFVAVPIGGLAGQNAGSLTSTILGTFGAPVYDAYRGPGGKGP